MINNELINLFFHDLKKYNKTNFSTIAKADLSVCDSVVHKAMSSVVTRFFIFAERHPDIVDYDIRMLYYKLKIDMIARYFAEYPASSYEDLRPFQIELQKYVRQIKDGDAYE